MPRRIISTALSSNNSHSAFRPPCPCQIYTLPDPLLPSCSADDLPPSFPSFLLSFLLLAPTRRMRGILSFLLVQAVIVSTATATKCYFSDGSDTGSEMQPCFPSSSVSACCSTNKKGDWQNDVCLQNGLCIAQVAQYSGMIFQNACTDKSWGSPDCPRICPTCMLKSLLSFHLGFVVY